jgi:glycerol-3-phosphate dehydrogenase (NAD(P)+)
MTRVGVLGAGSWGTTLAQLLAAKGHDVRLWAFEPEVAEAINARHENPVYLPDAPLDERLAATTTIGDAIDGAELIVSAAPSHAVRAVLAPVRDALAGRIVVSATKGLETGTLARMSQVVYELAPTARFVVLSGPSFAREVYDGQPTLVVAASSDLDAAKTAQQTFATPRFRVYTGGDVIGVELAGALKNVIAVAAGILDGLGLGSNTRAALITRGLAEMARVGVAEGAEPITFAGLAGMGDLILTATGDLSRNRALGLALAAGQSFETYQATHRSVAEGANASRAGAELARRHDVEMPIAERVCAVLFEGKPVRDTVAELMERELKAENWR